MDRRGGHPARRRVVHDPGRRAGGDRRYERRRKTRCWNDRRLRPDDCRCVRFDEVDVHATVGAFRACSATCRRTTSSTPTCRSRTLRCSGEDCGCRRRRPGQASTSYVDALDDQPHHPRRHAGRRPEGGQRKGQHRRRAARRPARVLPRRANVGPRPGDRRADHPPAPARRPLGHGRAHVALGRRPRPVRPSCSRPGGRVAFVERSTRRSSASRSARSPTLPRSPIPSASPNRPASRPAEALPVRTTGEVIRRPVTGALTQWTVLTQRTLEILRATA